MMTAVSVKCTVLLGLALTFVLGQDQRGQLTRSGAINRNLGTQSLLQQRQLSRQQQLGSRTPGGVREGQSSLQRAPSFGSSIRQPRPQTQTFPRNRLTLQDFQDQQRLRQRLTQQQLLQQGQQTRRINSSPGLGWQDLDRQSSTSFKRIDSNGSLVPLTPLEREFVINRRRELDALFIPSERNVIYRLPQTQQGQQIQSPMDTEMLPLSAVRNNQNRRPNSWSQQIPQGLSRQSPDSFAGGFLGDRRNWDSGLRQSTGLQQERLADLQRQGRDELLLQRQIEQKRPQEQLQAQRKQQEESVRQGLQIQPQLLQPQILQPQLLQPQLLQPQLLQQPLEEKVKEQQPTTTDSKGNLQQPVIPDSKGNTGSGGDVVILGKPMVADVAIPVVDLNSTFPINNVVKDEAQVKRDRIHELADLLSFRPSDLLNVVAELEARKNSLATHALTVASQKEKNLFTTEVTTSAPALKTSTVGGIKEPIVAQTVSLVLAGENSSNISGAVLNMVTDSPTPTTAGSLPSAGLPNASKPKTTGPYEQPTTYSFTTRTPELIMDTASPKSVPSPVITESGNSLFPSIPTLPVSHETITHTTTGPITRLQSTQTYSNIPKQTTDIVRTTEGNHVVQDTTARSHYDQVTISRSHYVQYTTATSHYDQDTTPRSHYGQDTTTTRPSETTTDTPIIPLMQVALEQAANSVSPTTKDADLQNARLQLASVAQNVIQALLQQSGSGNHQGNNSFLTAAQALLSEIQGRIGGSNATAGTGPNFVNQMIPVSNMNITESFTNMNGNNMAPLDSAINGTHGSNYTVDFNITMTTIDMTTIAENTTTPVPVTEATEAVPTPPPPPPGFPHMFVAQPGMELTEAQLEYNEMREALMP